MIFAHVAGVPVEELLPFVLASGAGCVAAVRTWVGERAARRRGRFVQDRRRRRA